MPILVKDYSWSESKETVHITVPLKGVKRANVGLTCTNEFLKTNYPPFLFEVLLYKEIDDDKSSIKVRDGSVEFNLVKMDPGLWGRLQSEKCEDKAYMLQKKLEAVKYIQKKTEESEKVESKRRSDNKRYAIKETMKLEEAEKSRIESLKESERLRTEKEMEDWKQKRKIEEEAMRKKLHDQRIEESFKSMENCDNVGEVVGEKISTDQNIFEDVVNKEKLDRNDDEEDVVNTDQQTQKPRSSQPRQGGNIKFKFTPRVFPTPLRESKTVEEEEWLQKQAEARKTKELDDPDLEEHEKDPEWLKDKGNKLFSSGNFLAAVNAYNLAIRLRPKMHVLYLNRAACHLKLRNLYKCVEDCSTSIDLLQPPVPENAKARLKAHIRRGTAFCELELYAEGLLDYNAAIKIDPTNESLKKDADNIKNVIEKGGEDSIVVSGSARDE